MRILDRLLLENLWRVSCFLTTDLSVVRKRLLLCSSSLVCWSGFKWHIWYTLVVSFQKIKIISYLEALVIWKLIFSLFLLIDTSDPLWPVTFQNSLTSYRILHCFSSLFFFFHHTYGSFLSCCGGKIHLYVALHASKLPPHILKDKTPIQFGLYLFT